MNEDAKMAELCQDLLYALEAPGSIGLFLKMRFVEVWKGPLGYIFGYPDGSYVLRRSRLEGEIVGMNLYSSKWCGEYPSLEEAELASRDLEFIEAL